MSIRTQWWFSLALFLIMLPLAFRWISGWQVSVKWLERLKTRWGKRKRVR
ncbi:hypothetical protein JIR001_11220 [Polycladomyces abyssicola]|uniref:Uncharacterized protein n=1 Tax=Polycladomyces abyssicola TaxID=1125966 RepID=A0A8D5UFH6_9BACL|nr:hypothetical protein [Polycladomyces abyssicola]BCU81339.1 hypothetical protein JIR001_11220 [Polycladomyces abyssicola]